MDALVPQLFAGLSVGSVLLLVALGLSLTFGQMGVINMAHGELIMVGAYTAYVVQQVVGGAGLSLLLALPLGFLVGGLVGLLMEVLVISRMYHRPLDTLLVTFGLGLVLQQAARDLFGAPAKEVVAPSWLSGQVELLGASFPTTRVFILVLSVGCVAATAALLQWTSLGRRVRATVQNRDLAETVGISTRATDRTTFFLGSGLAGIAGVAITLMGSTGPNLGQAYIVDAFLVVVAGGIGQVRGTVIAAFTLGMLQAAFEYSTTASLAKVVVLLLVVVFLQVRPQGLFSVRQRSLA